MISELDELLGLGEVEEFVESREFAGSLDYIDSLPTKPPFSIHTGFALGRDAADISNALIANEGVNLLSDKEALPRGSVLLTDNRVYSPRTYFDPGELTPGSSRLVDRYVYPPGPSGPVFVPPVEPRRPVKGVKDWVKRKAKLGFDLPGRVGICVKRKMRREVMHAFGLSGRWYRPRRFNMWSRVVC